MVDFIDSYQQYSTLSVVARVSCDACDWAEGVVAPFGKASVGRGVQVTLEVPPPLATFVADLELVTQALLNLLKNAAKAGARHVQLTVRGCEGWLELVVADDGIGFGDLFLPLSTSKSTGIGIGLSLARQVAVVRGTIIRDRRRPCAGAMFLVSMLQ